MSVSRRLMVVLASVAVLAVAACGSDNSSSSSATTARPGTGPAGAAPIEQTTWELGLGLLNLPGIQQARPTLRLVGGTASGSTGCNAYTGPYTLGRGTLTFGVMAQTNVACGPRETAIENAYLPRLGKIAKYTLDGNGLQLQDASGTTLLVYTAANTSLQGSWTVTGYLNASGSAFVSVVNGSTLNANFGADGNFSGTTGCNNLTGTWKQGPGDALSIGPLAMTRAACTSTDLSDQEHSYVTALQSSVKAEVNSSSATLYNPAGQRAVTLTR